MSHSRPAHVGARVRRKRVPGRQPETVAEGVAWLRAYAVQLFEREMGQEADWPVIAQTMFAASFSIIDEANGDQRAMKVLRRVEISLYERLTQIYDDELHQALGIGSDSAAKPSSSHRVLEPRNFPEPEPKTFTLTKPTSAWLDL